MDWLKHHTYFASCCCPEPYFPLSKNILHCVYKADLKTRANLGAMFAHRCGNWLVRGIGEMNSSQWLQAWPPFRYFLLQSRRSLWSVPSLHSGKLRRWTAWNVQVFVFREWLTGRLWPIRHIILRQNIRRFPLSLVGGDWPRLICIFLVKEPTLFWAGLPALYSKSTGNNTLNLTSTVDSSPD